MNFDKEGFTKQSGALLRTKQSENFSELFIFSDSCSQLAMEVISLTSNISQNPKLTSCMLYVRSVSHFQAAINLAQGGMTVESLVISRSLIETSFALAALGNGSVTPQELMDSDMASRVSHANSLMHSSGSYARSYKKQLGKFVQDNKGNDPISVYELARRGEALALYDGLYRHLSHHAAHPSISSADPYLFVKDKKPLVKFVPLISYTPAAILSACAGILISTYAIDRAEVRTPQTNILGTQLWDKYEVLNESYNPWKRD